LLAQQELLPGEELKKKEGEEIKKELRKAKHQLKQYELKIKSIEEEQKHQVNTFKDEIEKFFIPQPSP
jgi:hypothetical protein